MFLILILFFFEKKIENLISVEENIVFYWPRKRENRLNEERDFLQKVARMNRQKKINVLKVSSFSYLALFHQQHQRSVTQIFLY